MEIRLVHAEEGHRFRPHGGRRDAARVPVPDSGSALDARPVRRSPAAHNLHRSRTAGHRSGLRTAVAHDQSPAVAIARIGVRLDVVRNLFLQRRRQHPPRTLTGYLIQGRSDVLGRLGIVFACWVEYLQYWVVPPSPRPASQGGFVFTWNGYATCLTPPIHNFRLYLGAETLAFVDVADDHDRLELSANV